MYFLVVTDKLFFFFLGSREAQHRVSFVYRLVTINAVFFFGFAACLVCLLLLFVCGFLVWFAVVLSGRR